MLFSIIIPAFNCEETIERTVDSIAVSGIKDYEILIIDDGSTDKTGSICDSLAQKMPTVRCIHQANEGVSAARNCGIKNSLGDYLIFFDADDYVESNSFCNAVKIIEAEHPDILLFGMFFEYYSRGKVYRRDSYIPSCSGMLSLEQIKQYFSSLYLCNALTPVWNKIFSKELIIDTDTHFNTDMIVLEDFLFTLVALSKCDKVYCLQEAIYHYRQPEYEKHAYNRLCHINDLPEYLAPFSRQIELLGVSDSDRFMENLYKMLLEQRLYYASYKEICSVMTQHRNSIYSGIDIENRPFAIYLRNKKSQLRHSIAVIVKSIFCRLSGNR